MELSTLRILTMMVLLQDARGQDIGVHIVGGEDVGEQEFPFMAKLTFGGVFQCGCTILNPSWVLTAAHCTADVEPERFQVGYGSIRQDSRDMKLVEVKKAMYPSTMFTYKDDIVLLKVEPEIVLSENTTEAVQLPQMGDDTAGGTSATAVGWGKTSIDGQFSNTLQKVELPIMTNEECKDIYKERFYDSNVCAGSGGNNAAQDVCLGDAGGPLLVDNVQVGITSWGFSPCAVGPTHSFVFTKVSSYIDWIAETLEAN